MIDKTGFVECAICGKEFLPAPLHAWKISGDKLVCSYHCMRQYEVLHAHKKKHYNVKGK